MDSIYLKFDNNEIFDSKFSKTVLGLRFRFGNKIIKLLTIT
jgi:hypothetical protein